MGIGIGLILAASIALTGEAETCGVIPPNQLGMGTASLLHPSTTFSHFSECKFWHNSETSMAPHDGLVHLKEYDIKDSNVELIGSDIDHKVKFNSAATEPAWNDGRVGKVAGLYIWRIEDFVVVAWPADKAGLFYDGDSYIVLHSFKVGDSKDADKLGHDIFFWLGAKTSQDEAGTAAYKTVELDEFLHGAATQHRELQAAPSDAFIALFPRLTIRSGGVKSGFRHVEDKPKQEEKLTLLRVFKPSISNAVGPGRDVVVVHEVEPTWESLDNGDVFILDVGNKIWVWQGKSCSPMEKAKAAQVVHDMTIAKHVDVEVLSQDDSRSRLVVKLLSPPGDDLPLSFSQQRPVVELSRHRENQPPRKLFRLSDASGQLSFDLVKEGQAVSPADLDGKDVFLLDDEGRNIWVWVGASASAGEKGSWLNVARQYIRHLEVSGQAGDACITPIAKVQQGHENRSFLRAIKAA